MKKLKAKARLVPVTVRLPDALVRDLSEVADKSGRKLQAVYALALRRGVEELFREGA